MTDAPAPGWYPDPSGLHEQRYWDGTRWTEHVADHGRQSVDPIVHGGAVPTTADTGERVRDQVQRAAGVTGAPAGGGTLFTEHVLVVNQKVKVIELDNEYAVFDQHGTQLGAIRQVGQSTAKKAARLMGGFDQFMTHSLQLVDMSGTVVLTVTRPRKFAKSKVHVTDGAGNEIGSIVQRNMVGRIRFGLEAGGEEIGTLNGENWRAWNFSIRDGAGDEVGRITKTWEGLAKTMFTTADNYVLEIHSDLTGPLRSLVVASAVSVDLALKQDSRGWS